MFYYARIAKYNRMWRNIYIYKTIRSYHHIIANGNFSNNSRIDTNPNSIANSWTTFARAPIRLSYNNTFMNVTITTYFSFTIDGYIICMTYINTPPIWLFAVISKPLRFAHRRNNTLYKSLIGGIFDKAALR